MGEAWTEVRVVVPEGWHELVGEVLARETAESVAFGPPSLGSAPLESGHELVRAFLPARDDGPAARARIAAALAELARRSGAPELRGLAAHFHELPPEDYATSWMKAWKPFRAGHLEVVPPWYAPAPRAGDLRLVFQPQSAFGSGRHATTRTCLVLLQGLVRGGERVLDAGTGSGLLAVAAVKLGARSALGFDIDPNSPPGAAALAAHNGVEARCEFRLGDFSVLGPADSAFELVLANLYADVLQDLAGELAARLGAGGALVASGIPSAKLAPTRAALQDQGLVLERELARGRWHTLLARHPARQAQGAGPPGGPGSRGGSGLRSSP